MMVYVVLLFWFVLVGGNSHSFFIFFLFYVDDSWGFLGDKAPSGERSSLGDEGNSSSRTLARTWTALICSSGEQNI
jgi:hypothetical protein